MHVVKEFIVCEQVKLCVAPGHLASKTLRLSVKKKKKNQQSIYCSWFKTFKSLTDRENDINHGYSGLLPQCLIADLKGPITCKIQFTWH